MKLHVFRLLWIVFYPIFWTTGSIWPFLIFPQATKLARQYNTKLIYTTSGPFSTWILGYLLKRRLGIKWVADIRDPFTDGYMWAFPTKLHWFCARKFEKWILAKADHVIVNTKTVKNLYLKRNIINQSKISHITNGY